ncbi:MAG: allophanate hydrolase subunit 1 [Verrucomicrobiota bacterium]
MPFKLKAYGERSWLVDGLEHAARFALEAALLKSPPDFFEEHVLGHSNVLLVFTRPLAKSALLAWLSSIDLEPSVALKASPRHKVPVIYDGPDLEEVAGKTGLSVDEMIAIHAGADYTVRMIGFTPGFPYLDGLDPRLELDRRDLPRTRIEPGTVAIGGPHAGIYSVASPGGWHLLGRTNFELFRPERAKGDDVEPAEAFGLQPGDRVRFVPQG